MSQVKTVRATVSKDLASEILTKMVFFNGR